MKKANPRKAGYKWTLLIEFNGLCAAELIKPPKGKPRPEMIIHFVHDSMHYPILAVRDRDVVEAHNCRPDYKLLTRGETEESLGRRSDHEETGVPTTLSVWPTVHGAHQGIMNTNDWALVVNTAPRKFDKSKPPKPANPDSLNWLPELGEILKKTKCNPLHDFAQFRLRDGVVIPGRLDPDRLWEITVDGNPIDKEEKERPIAVTIIYKLVVRNLEDVSLDLHPGTLTLGPPHSVLKKLQSGKLDNYTVETTYSSLPVAHSAHDPAPHFNEYNRLVDTDHDVRIREIKPKATVEDPIHCFDAAVLP